LEFSFLNIKLIDRETTSKALRQFLKKHLMKRANQEKRVQVSKSFVFLREKEECSFV